MRQRIAFVVSCAIAAAAFAADPYVQPKGSGIIRNPASRPAAATQSATIDLIVRFRDRATPQRLDAFRGDLARLRGNRFAAQASEIRNEYRVALSGASVRVPREMRQAIATLPYVKAVDEDRKVVAMECGGDAAAFQSGGNAAALQRGTGIRVAVIDTGIDYTHPALGGGFGEGYKVASGWDFFDADADPMDENGHGTHVAGIIAADSEDITGVAPGVTLVAYRVLGPQGQGDLSDALAAIERAVDPNQDGDPSDHVDVVNMSLGARFFTDDDPAVAAVENATALGVVFSIAAGNFGDYGNLPTPAFAPSAITVAASNGSEIAPFSSRGPSYTYAIKPDVAAPGVNIMSTLPGNKKGELHGTSMAAPYVAGIAALIREAHPNWTPAAIKSAIVNSASPVNAEVLVGGAGRAEPVNATSATIVSEPVSIGFGQNNDLQPVWTSARTITLHNTSSESQTLTANINGLRDGVVVHVAPSTLTLAAGESAAVTVDIEVDNAKVPAPIDWGTMSFDGSIEWSGSTARFVTPWAFVKAAFLTIDVPAAANDWIFEILGHKWQYGSDLNVYQGRVYWMLEKVDVMAWEFSRPSQGKPDRIVFVEEVDTRTTSYVPVDIDQARLSVGADTTDARGGPLHAGDRLCIEMSVFAFPTGRRKTFEYVPSDRTLFAPVSDRAKIYVRDSCSDLQEPAVYIAIHEPFRGLQESVTTTSRPQWITQDLVFDPGFETHMTGFLPALWFHEGPDEFYFTGGNFYLMRPTPARVTAHYAKPPAANIETHVVVERWGHCPLEGYPEAECAVLSSLHLRLGEHETTVENDYFPNVTPMAYRITPGSTLTVGVGPLWPRLGFTWTPGAWVASGWWSGGLGEHRGYAADTLHTVLRDASGNVVGEGGTSVFKNQSIPLAAYRIESTNPNARVFGRPAVAKALATLDLTDEQDRFFPLITGMRIVNDEQQVTDWIDHGESGVLLLSMLDYNRVGDRYKPMPPNESATRVEYRVHGTEEWHALAPVVTDRDYKESFAVITPIGTVFTVDLSPVTATQFGAIDLRVHAEDEHTHAIEYELSPAFYVRDAGRRRSARK